MASRHRLYNNTAISRLSLNLRRLPTYDKAMHRVLVAEHKQLAWACALKIVEHLSIAPLQHQT